MISVVIPTIVGREDHLARCKDAYRFRTKSEHALELIVVHDRPTVGIAWNVGAKHVRGEYLHFTNDDCEPMEGWDVAALRTVADGAIPAPGLIVRTDGTVDRQLADGQVVTAEAADIDTIPFCSREQFDRIGPFLDTHYFGDSFFSWRARKVGIPILGCEGYRFVHHWASVGRGAGMDPMERMRVDEAAFNAAVAAG